MVHLIKSDSRVKTTHLRSFTGKGAACGMLFARPKILKGKMSKVTCDKCKGQYERNGSTEYDIKE